MVWVRIDDQFSEHPKVAEAGPLAMAMQVAALCYCNRKLTDGYIPRSVARTLLDWQVVDDRGKVYTIAITSGMTGNDVDCDWVIRLLIAKGMWHQPGHDCESCPQIERGYVIHDYLDQQPSREQVLAEREQKKQAGRKGGVASAEARRKKARAKAAGTARAQAGAVSGEAGAQAESKQKAKQKAKQNPTPVPVPVPKEQTPLARARADAPPPVDNPAPGGTATPSNPTPAPTLDSQRDGAIDHAAPGSNPMAAAPDAPPDGAPSQRRSQRVLDRLASESPPHIGGPLRAGFNGQHVLLVAEALDAGWSIDGLVTKLSGGWNGVHDPPLALAHRLRRIGPAPPAITPPPFDPAAHDRIAAEVAPPEVAAPWRDRIRNQLTEETDP